VERQNYVHAAYLGEYFASISAVYNKAHRELASPNEVHFINYYAPVYPQLWGDFIKNLSLLDLLFNCGPRSRDIILRCGS
jgi:hypothetical protein